ncbi:MAG: 2-hydroxyacyl-CoA dehydratase [Acidobacteriia bacterium]|nr:2-hydroxyacyl-CoA dehydratase [Terriglobia bacterium]
MMEVLSPNIERTFDQCAELLRDLTFPTVAAWKQEHPGAKVIGYFPVYAPSEIIHACGMLPVALHGAGDGLELQHADARFGSFICSIVKSTLELAMTDRLAQMDGLLFSTICDSARNLAWVIKRNQPGIYVDFLHLPHNPNGTASHHFLVSEYRRLIGHLEELSGNKVTDEALRNSIAIYNENRRLLSRLYDFRMEHPERLRTWELYVLMRAGNFVPVETHNEWLRGVLEELPGRSGKKRDAIRVVVEGSFCEQPPLDLIKVMEEAGCTIADDDFILGRRWFNADIPVEGDPLMNMAESYQDRSVYSSVRHDFRNPRHKQLLEKVKHAKAQAVVFLTAKFCEPACFDYVLFKKELEAAKIPHLPLEFEEKAYTFDRFRMEVETFVESLLFE